MYHPFYTTTVLNSKCEISNFFMYVKLQYFFKANIYWVQPNPPALMILHYYSLLFIFLIQNHSGVVKYAVFKISVSSKPCIVFVINMISGYIVTSL